MNLTWHIIRKDLRRMRWAALLLAATVAGQVAIGSAIVGGFVTNPDAFEQLGGYVKMLVGLQWIVSFVIVGWLVHEDPVTRADAFWVTRPISGPRLLTAKLGGIALINVLLPVLMFLPWWLLCGYGTRQVMLAAAGLGAVQAVVSTVALVVAVLTNSATRFVAYALVLLISLPALRLLNQAASLTQPAAPFAPELDDHRAFAMQLLLVLAVAAVVLHQYLWRRTTRSWGLLGCGVLMAAGAGNLGPWVHTSPPGTFAPESAPMLSVEVEKAVLHDGAKRSTGDSTIPLDLHLNVHGFAPDTVLWGLRVGVALRWRDGTTFTARTLAKQLTLANRDESAWRAVGLQSWHKETKAGRVTLELPSALAARWSEESPALGLCADAVVLQATVVGTMPLRAGSRLAPEAHGVRIVGVGELDAQRVAIRVVETTPAWSSGETPLLVTALFPPSPDYGQYFVQSADGAVTRRPSTRHSSTNAMRVGTVGVFLNTLELWPRRVRDDAGWATDPEWPQWLDEATLTKVGVFGRGEFRQRIDLATLAAERPTAQP